MACTVAVWGVEHHLGPRLMIGPIQKASPSLSLTFLVKRKRRGQSCGFVVGRDYSVMVLHVDPIYVQRQNASLGPKRCQMRRRTEDRV